MANQYTIGLDYGTNSVRALIVDTANGREAGTAVWNYEHGTAGVILSRDPNLARQHPADYIKGAEITIKKALADAKNNVRGFKPEQVVGIGVDTTGSTPLPMDPKASHSHSIKDSPKIPRRWRGCGKTTQALPKPPKSPHWQRSCVRNFWPSAVGFIRVNGSGVKFSTVFAPRRKSSMLRIRGSNLPITFLPRSRARNIRTNSSRAFALPVTRRCGTQNGAVIPMRNSSPGSIRSSANFVRGSRPASIRLTAPSAA